MTKGARVHTTPTLNWVSVSESELAVADLVAWAVRPEYGAIVTFCGTVRTDSSEHDSLERLEYETSVELAEENIAEVIDAARARWPDVGAIAVHHRIGRIELSEAAVVIAVTSPHRRTAFAAAQFCIDTLKEAVPMWKREIWRDGVTWSTATQSIVKIPAPKPTETGAAVVRS